MFSCVNKHCNLLSCFNSKTVAESICAPLNSTPRQHGPSQRHSTPKQTRKKHLNAIPLQNRRPDSTPHRPPICIQLQLTPLQRSSLLLLRLQQKYGALNAALNSKTLFFLPPPPPIIHFASLNPSFPRRWRLTFQASAKRAVGRLLLTESLCLQMLSAKT